MAINGIGGLDIVWKGYLLGSAKVFMYIVLEDCHLLRTYSSITFHVFSLFLRSFHGAGGMPPVPTGLTTPMQAHVHK